MRYSLQNEYGYSGTIRYSNIRSYIASGVRILYGRIICGRRIFFELQYGTSTVRVQSYKFEYSTSKRRGLISTVRYRSLVNLQQDKSTGTVFVRKMRTVCYSPGSIHEKKSTVRTSTFVVLAARRCRKLLYGTPTV